MRDSVHNITLDMAAKIESGEWPDGHRLPPERTLAVEHGLARNTLRQALDDLEHRGLIVRQVGRGTFVQGPGRARPTDPLLARMRNASPMDLVELRLIIEPQAAALAATRATAEDLAAIEAALRHSVLAKGAAEFEHWDASLHIAIFRATKNGLLVDYCEAITRIRNQAGWHRLKQRTVTPQARHVYDRHHSEIVTALRERDGESTRRAMVAHLTAVREHLVGAMGAIPLARTGS